MLDKIIIDSWLSLYVVYIKYSVKLLCYYKSSLWYKQEHGTKHATENADNANTSYHTLPFTIAKPDLPRHTYQTKLRSS